MLNTIKTNTHKTVKKIFQHDFILGGAFNIMVIISNSSSNLGPDCLHFSYQRGINLMWWQILNLFILCFKISYITPFTILYDGGLADILGSAEKFRFIFQHNPNCGSHTSSISVVVLGSHILVKIKEINSN